MNGRVVNACDAQDEREAAGVPAPAPNLDVEKLFGLSRMIAARTTEQLDAEVKAALDPFLRLFRSRSSDDQAIVISTFSNSDVRITDDPKHPGKHLIRVSVFECGRLAELKAVEIHRQRRVAEALKDFLERTESVADEIAEIRDQVQS